jgi:exosortase/archaeosortase family protein
MAMTRDRIDAGGDGAVTRTAFPLAGTCLLFGACMLLFHLVLWFTVPEGGDPLRAATTYIVSRLLDLVGITNVADTTHIRFANAYWEVTPECTAVNVFILYVSFILAYPARLRSRGIALLIGLPFIFIANIGRLVVLGLATVHFPGSTRWFHDYIWQAVFVLLVVVMWLVWIGVVVKREESPSLPG